MSISDTNITVVVIGKNEERTLGRIFENFKELYCLMRGRAQLIYVDSGSKDKSLLIAKEFQGQNNKLNVRIIGIQGKSNAAIARNIGISHVDNQSKYIFFLDGDIIFNTEFVTKAILVMEENEKIASVCGTIVDSYNTTDTKGVIRSTARISAGNVVLWHGGNFVIKKTIVEQIGLFDDNLIMNEDIDYSFRMRNKGYILWFIDQQLGTHYTTSYMNCSRILIDLKSGKYMCAGLLFRKYFFSKRCVDMLKSIPGILFRLFVICCAILSIFFYPLGAIALLGFLVVLSRKKAERGETFWSRTLSFIIGILFIFGLFKVRRRPTYEIQVV